MNGTYRIEKVVNNNVVIAQSPELNEVILIGKGIGFGRKKGQHIQADAIDKLFVLKDKEEQKQYRELLSDLDEALIIHINEIIRMIQRELPKPLYERIHLALTDHIQFAIRRLEQGIEISNPFLTETEMMFPNEFHLARKAVDYLNAHLTVELPEAEIGFVALHIYSASSNQPLSEMNEHPQLVSELVEIIMEKGNVSLNRRSVEYMRLVSFLCELIDRFQSTDIVNYSPKLSDVLKEEFELCYTVSSGLINVLNQRFNTHYKAEQLPEVVFYLQRFIK